MWRATVSSADWFRERKLNSFPDLESLSLFVKEMGGVDGFCAFWVISWAIWKQINVWVFENKMAQADVVGSSALNWLLK